MARGVGGPSPSNVQSYLKGVSYPASKNQLVMAAKRNGAPREVLEVLTDLDEEGEFDGPQDVMQAYRQERHAG
jgi:hypothetical protein